MFSLKPDFMSPDLPPERSLIGSHSPVAQLGYAAQLARCEELCGLSLTVLNSSDQRFASGIPREVDSEATSRIASRLKQEVAAIEIDQQLGVWVYGVRVPATPLWAGGILLPIDGTVPASIGEAAQRLGLSEGDLQVWSRRQSGIRPALACKLLQSAHDLTVAQSIANQTSHSSASLSTKLGDTYEEVVLLQDIAQYLRPDIDPLSLAEAVLERLRVITETSLSAFCLRFKNADSNLIHGAWGLTGEDLEGLLRELNGPQSPRIIVRNHIDQSPLADRYPNLKSLAAVPLFEEELSPSWLVLANPTDQRELGTEEANLLKSVGGVLAAHTQVVELFQEHQEMVLAFIRSLVSTLDAKDPYTRGHSERVALVAQRIAKELNLSHSETESIYQSGLLHDIGKIGVDDAVLRKEESLSAQEFRKISRHPEVGYSILSELKGLEDLLPGVLHHHERYDGRGYPAKLAGQAIPRMARILAVADSYDAMGSDRPYRRGMKREDVERILAHGSGTQWDPEVIQAFFKARHDIHRIWSKAIERQKQDDQLDAQQYSPEYAAVAEFSTI